ANNVCSNCHDGSRAEIPLQRTHSSTVIGSSLHGVWESNCIDCHDPHYQGQLAWIDPSTQTYPAELYLVNGTIGTITAGTLTDTTNIAYSNVPPDNQTGDWTDRSRWGNKNANSDFERGLILVVNTGRAENTYQVISANDSVITVKGIINSTDAGKSFGLIYGQLIKKKITTSQGDREVKFFDPNGFTDDTMAVAGICQVCHTETKYYKNDGTGASHNSGACCTQCHLSKEGFKVTCDACHGFPPVNNTAAQPDGLVWLNGKITGSLTAGAHELHAVKYSCSTCHQNSAGSGATHNNGNITLGFSIFNGAYSGGSYDGQSSVAYDSSGGTVITTVGTKTCSAYCHGSTMAPDGGSNTTPVWDNPSTAACGTCHGTTADNPPTLGSHLKHAGSANGGLALSCTFCHYGYEPLHVNNQADFTFDTGTYPWLSDAVYSGDTIMLNIYGSCSNVYCHSNGTGGTTNTGETRSIAANTSPAWGSATSCGSCHGGGDASGRPSYPNGTPKANSHNASAHSYIKCNACHWPLTETGNTIKDSTKHANKLYDIGNSAGTLSYTYNSGGGSCSNIACHDDATWGGPTPTHIAYNECLSCHKGVMDSRRQIVDSNGNGTGTGGDFKKTTHHITTPVAGQVTVKNPTATTAGTGGFTDPANAYALDSIYATCTSDGNTQLYENFGVTLLGDAQIITKVEIGVTGFYTAATTRTSQFIIQISWDGGTTWSGEGVVNLPINTATTQFKDFTWSTTWKNAKLSNSNFKVRVRNYFTSTPATTNHLDWIQVRVTYNSSTAPITNTACLVCHDTLQHMGGTVRLKDADTGAIYAYDPANPTTAENFCLSCHDTNGANGNMSPFADGSTIGVIPYRASKDVKASWQKTYGHKQQGLTCLGNGNPTTGCHSNGHGSDNVGLLSKNLTLPAPGTYYNPLTDEGHYEMCFSCHQNYPRITKEAVLGYRSGGHYDTWGDGQPPYNITDIKTNFRDRYDGSAKNYDDGGFWTGYSNLHYFHAQAGTWAYRDSIQ
ncbi:MAG: CxxxxCH/CxxCH domain-containing protein, partial [Desulfobulbaceae bacterium]|nr:CxxxxCH/CxxCH domain-containing protein [Desulfobulbaceae bacterium]